MASSGVAGTEREAGSAFYGLAGGIPERPPNMDIANYNLTTIIYYTNIIYCPNNIPHGGFIPQPWNGIFPAVRIKSANLFVLFTHIQTRRGLDMDIENTVFIGIYIVTVCEDDAILIRIKNYI